MEEQRLVLDGSKVLFHQDRIKQWNYGEGRVAPHYNRLRIDYEMQLQVCILLWENAVYQSVRQYGLEYH